MLQCDIVASCSTLCIVNVINITQAINSVTANISMLINQS